MGLFDKLFDKKPTAINDAAGADKLQVFEKDIAGNVFSVKAEAALQPQANTLFQIIEEIPAERIKDGFRIEAGFTMFTLSKSGNTYCVKAPDYSKNPLIDFTDDLTLAMWVQLEQTHFLRKYGITGESVKFSDRITVAKAALNERKINMQRFADRSEGDSGWCIESTSSGVTADAADNYEAFYAYRLLILRPALVKVLALPSEYIAVFDGDDIKAILDPFDNDITGV
jgi:hypothetical protein